MTSAPLLTRATLAGLLSGGLAALAAVVPALMGTGDTRMAEYEAMLVLLVATHLGLAAAMRRLPSASFQLRLGSAAVAALVAATVLGVALHQLYAVWRPGLLGARYALLLAEVAQRGDAARAAAMLADLAARRAQQLDPGYQALSGAGTPLFFSLVVGGYSTFRWRVAQRLAASAARRVAR